MAINKDIGTSQRYLPSFHQRAVSSQADLTNRFNFQTLIVVDDQGEVVIPNPSPDVYTLANLGFAVFADTPGRLHFVLGAELKCVCLASRVKEVLASSCVSEPGSSLVPSKVNKYH